MTKIPTLEEMLKAGLHFGHKASRRYPKMEPYIFTTRNNINIINLELTQEKLREALDFLKKVASGDGTVLFVGTKSQALPIVEKYAKECGMPYINGRWLGGTLTNFPIIKQSIKKYNRLREEQEKGELKKYTKREQVMINKMINDMAKKVEGIKNLEKTPDALFVLDVKNEKTAVGEAKKKNIPIVAICDTNVNPSAIEYVIPANDDAISSMEMMVGLAAEAIKEGKASPKPKQEEKENDNDNEKVKEENKEKDKEDKEKEEDKK